MIIFLDIDGVIATMESYKDHSDLLDRTCINVLNVLTNRVKAKIVISSAWRIEGLDILQDKLKGAGVKAEIIGVTPRLKQESYTSDTKRGKEILQWIKDNNYEGDYLVLDDDVFDIRGAVEDERILWIKKGWFNHGLTPRHIRNIKEIEE